MTYSYNVTNIPTLLEHINIPVQHMQAYTERKKEACCNIIVPYSHKKDMGIFYMHYQIDMITHGALLLRQITSYRLHALSQDIMTHGQPLVNQSSALVGTN